MSYVVKHGSKWCVYLGNRAVFLSDTESGALAWLRQRTEK